MAVGIQTCKTHLLNLSLSCLVLASQNFFFLFLFFLVSGCASFETPVRRCEKHSIGEVIIG